jgi:hypothetical protein
MLFSISNSLEERTLDTGPEASLVDPEDAALLEAFALHARALIEFLWHERSKGWRDNGRAEDYFAAGKWASTRRPMQSTLDGVFQRASWGIIHISYRRTHEAEDAQWWQFGHIAASVGRGLRVFLENVSSERVVPEFVDQAWDAMPRELRAPIAISWPPDIGAQAAATPVHRGTWTERPGRPR